MCVCRRLRDLRVGLGTDSMLEASSRYDGDDRGLASTAVVGGGSTGGFGGLHGEGVATRRLVRSAVWELLPRHNAIDFCPDEIRFKLWTMLKI